MEGRPDVLHDDIGRKALEWADGTGYYCLHGVEFDEGLYFKTINGELSLGQVAALDDADQRSISLSYLTFNKLIAQADAAHLDTGVRARRCIG